MLMNMPLSLPLQSRSNFQPPAPACAGVGGTGGGAFSGHQIPSRCPMWQNLTVWAIMPLPWEGPSTSAEVAGTVYR